MAVIDVVQYEGGPNNLAWKYPMDELGTWTQLVVNETQEALLFKNGQATDLFQAGRHTLSTANIPGLNKIVNLPFGGESPFKAEVWFVNKAFSLDIKWGTPTPIQLQDPKYKVFINVRSYGQFGIQVEDSRKFLLKLVGSMPSFDKNSLTEYFRGQYLTKVKDSISGYLIKRQISILEINAYLDEISEYLKERIIPFMAEYGIKLANFNVNDISIPEDDPAVKTLKDALAKRAEMDIVGYNYAQERSFDTLEGAANNQGGGQAGIMGAGMGLGMGLNIGNGFGQQMGNMTQMMNVKETKPCPSCGAAVEADKRFCAVCGHDVAGTKPAETKSEVVNCSSCGNAFSKNSKFCPECGNVYKPCSGCGADLKDTDQRCPVCGLSAPEPCPKCGYEIKDANAKFCPDCGNSLVKKCGSCGVQINGKPKFCPECGNKLVED